MPPHRVGVLASGSGSNLQALLDRFNSGGDPSATVVLIIGSRPGIRALERARDAGVATQVLPGEGTGERAGEAEFLLGSLADANVQLVVLAGYLRLVPATVVRQYRGRMINIHPALLPSFGGGGMYGHRVHEAVLSCGCRVTGVTVHFVGEEYDRGPIIAQWPVPVREGDDPGRLAERVLRIEHRLLPAVVSAIARGWVSLSPDGLSRWERPLFDAEGFTTEAGSPVPELEHSGPQTAAARAIPKRPADERG